MTRAVALGLLVVAALAQSTLVGRLGPGMPEPNLVVALVVARAWTAGGRSALGWAVAGGLLLDLAASGPFGLHLLATVAAAFVAATLGELLDDRSPLPLVPVAFLAAGTYAAVILTGAEALGTARVNAGSALVMGVLAAAVTSPVALLPAWVAGRRLAREPAW